MGLELWQIAGLHQWGELLVQSGRIPEEEESEEEDAPEEYADHQEDEECRCWNCGTTCFWTTIWSATSAPTAMRSKTNA